MSSFLSSRRRHTRCLSDWSSDVCSSDLLPLEPMWIGTLTLRASYSEAFHAPTLPDLTPAGTEIFAPIGGLGAHDPTGQTPDRKSVVQGKRGDAEGLGIMRT